jgi:hypothetical protein
MLQTKVIPDFMEVIAKVARNYNKQFSLLEM